MFSFELLPGTFVRHPKEPSWGLGQIQSYINDLATVNFEHRGKVVINTKRVELELDEET